MKWLIVAIVSVFLFQGVGGVEAVPPRSTQPHPDTFTGSYGNLQDYNAVTIKAKSQRLTTYTLTTRAGCQTGLVPDGLSENAVDMATNFGGFQFIRVTANADIDVIIACGTEQVNKCGSANTYCVRGKPFYGDEGKPTVYISDVLSTYYRESRLAILLHELMHAIATWNEQYCVGYETTGPCAGQPQFTPTPNHPDFMNTGPLSRHTITELERERWDRTMYPILFVVPPCGFDPSTGYDSCIKRYVMPDGWSYEPLTGDWWDPKGVRRFGPCNADGYRLDYLDAHWWRIPDDAPIGFDFGNGLNLFVVIPRC